MKLLHPEWRSRLDHWKRCLTEDFYEPLGEIAWEAYRTTEHIPHTKVNEREFVPVSEGFTWGNSWEYCWFRGKIVLPDSAEGKRIVMNLAPGNESTLFVNGKVFGTYRKKAIFPPVKDWEFYEDNLLSVCAKSGETFEILMETYAGHFIPEYIGPVLNQKQISDPMTEGARVTLGRSTYGIFNEDAYQLFIDVDTLDRIYGTLEETSLRAMQIGKGLREFTKIVDFEQSAEERIASYRQAREMLHPLFEAKNGSVMPTCYMVGESHLDLAWLWPLEETHRKTARTFAAQIRLLELYPDFKFFMSQPASYDMCRKYYPDLFEKIKEAVADGRWIPEGSLWVEPDLNLTGGEALIRQFVYGKRFYKEEFGTDSELVWVPDTFGYTAALPQIMKGCGSNYFMTTKLFWTQNDWDEFPYHYFHWEGIDGSRVTSLFTNFNLPYPDAIQGVWKKCGQPDMDSFLIPFGYGDGGGGPTRDHVEYALRQKDLQGAAPVVIKRPNEMFHHLDELGGPENTYVGELYFCAHRGTLTTQALIKKNNRKAELALREMEFWTGLAMQKGFGFEAQKAQNLWKDLLLHQFHDVLPGSSIERVNEETHKTISQVISQAEEMGENARKVLMAEKDSDAVSIFNSLSFARTELVDLPDVFEEGAQTADGTFIPVWHTGQKIHALVNLPSCGAVTLYPAANVKKESVTVNLKKEFALVSRLRKEGQEYILENSCIIAKVNGNGEVTSYIRKDSGREFVGGSLNRFRLYKDVPRDCDAWDIDCPYMEMECGSAENVMITPVSEGLEAVLKVTGTISHSTYTQYIRLQADSDILRFDTEMDWHEMHRLLKVDFTSNVYTENAINEIQFGYIERPTHRSRKHDRDRFEVCNHRYSALQDGAHGVALFNDCKYGISMNGSTLSLTLLRAAIQPQIRTDNGMNTFTYAFCGWNGSFAETAVPAKAYALNVPPCLTKGSLENFSILSADKSNILLDTLKPAEDLSGDLILRFYEAQKAPVTTLIESALLKGKKAYICDMLENIQEEIPVTDAQILLTFHAFEIKTVRIR